MGQFENFRVNWHTVYILSVIQYRHRNTEILTQLIYKHIFHKTKHFTLVFPQEKSIYPTWSSSVTRLLNQPTSTGKPKVSVKATTTKSQHPLSHTIPTAGLARCLKKTQPQPLFTPPQNRLGSFIKRCLRKLLEPLSKWYSEVLRLNKLLAFSINHLLHQKGSIYIGKFVDLRTHSRFNLFSSSNLSLEEWLLEQEISRFISINEGNLDGSVFQWRKLTLIESSWYRRVKC